MSEFDAITVPPKRPWAYVWHYVRLYPRWYWAIAALQIGAAMTATLMPYAIGRITGAVSDGLWDHADLWQASLPALGLLFGLAVAQMLCARGATLCMIMVRQEGCAAAKRPVCQPAAPGAGRPFQAGSGQHDAT